MFYASAISMLLLCILQVRLRYAAVEECRRRFGRRQTLKADHQLVFHVQAAGTACRTAACEIPDGERSAP